MTAISNMYICICNGINEDNLKEIINKNEITSMPELKQFGVCDNCSSCFDSALDVLKDCVDERFKNEDWYISPKEGCHWDINYETN
jgi:bacterioferritin-associated ferredoxin